MHQSLVEIGDRSDGTKGEKAAMELIVKHLEAFNIPYRRDPLSSFGPGYSYSENILGIIPGLNEDNIFLAAPVDSSAFGIALMLYLASHIKAGEHENGLIMAFLGAENGSDSYYPYGSRRAQINIEQSGSRAVIYLQSEYHPEKWHLQTGGNNSLPPYWLIKSLTSLLNQHNLSYSLNGVDLLVAEAGMQGNTSATRVWVQGGIPIARLEGLASPSSSDSSLSEHETAKRFLNVISSLLDAPLAKNNTAEYKYLFLRFLAPSSRDYFGNCLHSRPSHPGRNSSCYNTPESSNNTSELSAVSSVLETPACSYGHYFLFPVPYFPNHRKFRSRKRPARYMETTNQFFCLYQDNPFFPSLYQFCYVYFGNPPAQPCSFLFLFRTFYKHHNDIRLYRNQHKSEAYMSFGAAYFYWQ